MYIYIYICLHISITQPRRTLVHRQRRRVDDRLNLGLEGAAYNSNFPTAMLTSQTRQASEELDLL